MKDQDKFNDTIKTLTKRVKPGDEWKIDLSQELKRYQEYALCSDFGGNNCSEEPGVANSLHGSFIEAGLVVENASIIYGMRVDDALQTTLSCAQSLRRSLLNSECDKKIKSKNERSIHAKNIKRKAKTQTLCQDTNESAMSNSCKKSTMKTDVTQHCSFSMNLIDQIKEVNIKLDSKKREISQDSLFKCSKIIPTFLQQNKKDKQDLTNEPIHNNFDEVTSYKYDYLLNTNIVNKLFEKFPEKATADNGLKSQRIDKRDRTSSPTIADSGFESSSYASSGFLSDRHDSISNASNDLDLCLRDLTSDALAELSHDYPSHEILVCPPQRVHSSITTPLLLLPQPPKEILIHPQIADTNCKSANCEIPIITDAIHDKYRNSNSKLVLEHNLFKLPEAILTSQENFELPTNMLTNHSIGFLQLRMATLQKHVIFTLPADIRKSGLKRGQNITEIYVSPRKLTKTDNTVRPVAVKAYNSSSDELIKQPNLPELIRKEIQNHNIPSGDVSPITKVGRENNSVAMNEVPEFGCLTTNIEESSCDVCDYEDEGFCSGSSYSDSLHSPASSGYDSKDCRKMLSDKLLDGVATLNELLPTLQMVSMIKRMNQDFTMMGDMPLSPASDGGYETCDSGGGFSPFYVNGSSSTPKMGSPSSIDLSDSVSTTQETRLARPKGKVQKNIFCRKQNLTESYRVDDPDMDDKIHQWTNMVKSKLSCNRDNPYKLGKYKQRLMQFMNNKHHCTMHDILIKTPKIENGRFLLAALQLTNEKQLGIVQKEQDVVGDPKSICLKLRSNNSTSNKNTKSVAGHSTVRKICTMKK